MVSEESLGAYRSDEETLPHEEWQDLYSRTKGLVEWLK
jgi:hypothetical protein